MTQAFYHTRVLGTFDKIHIASCAIRRAEDNILDSRRFADEYKTAKAWKGHRVYQTTDSTGHPMGWLSEE